MPNPMWIDAAITSGLREHICKLRRALVGSRYSTETHRGIGYSFPRGPCADPGKAPEWAKTCGASISRRGWVLLLVVTLWDQARGIREDISLTTLPPSGSRLSHRRRHRANSAGRTAVLRAAIAAAFHADRQLYSRLAETPCRRATTETGRPPPLPWLPAPPFTPRSTADGAQRQPRHPLQRLLLEPPEGPSFSQRSPRLHAAGRFRPAFNYPQVVVFG